MVGQSLVALNVQRRGRAVSVDAHDRRTWSKIAGKYDREMKGEVAMGRTYL
jgi:hypothetical protein